MGWKGHAGSHHTGVVLQLATFRAVGRRQEETPSPDAFRPPLMATLEVSSRYVEEKRLRAKEAKKKVKAAPAAELQGIRQQQLPSSSTTNDNPSN